MGEDTAQVWLVDRTVTEKPSLINHIYATEDGERYYQQERSKGGSDMTDDTTAAIDVNDEKLSAVDNDELREEYAAEASRMADRHDPNDSI